MTLHAYRSQRVEELVLALGAVLEATWPGDPFEPVPILVGSRGMERWLRHELATRLGGVARVDFLFPRAVFDGAARWLTGDPDLSDRTVFWERPATSIDPWSGPPLRMRVLASVRARIREPDFERIRQYLGDVGGDVRDREIVFAGEVAGAVEQLLYDRPDDALAWATDPAAAPGEHAWLAFVLHDLGRASPEPSPAERLRDVQARARVRTGRPLFVFCLSTLRPGDKLRIAELARHLEVHLFALTPSSEWWQDIRQRSAQRAALRDAKSPPQIASLLDTLRQQNTLLAANGEPSRDLQQWLETLAYDDPIPAAPLAAEPTLLGRLHGWIDRAEVNPRAEPGGEAPWSALAGCPSFEVHACHNPLRQCEVLRDELLRRFAADETLEPRHVLVMTPDVGAYAPLLAAVFARGGGGTPAIPVSIADLGIRATNSVADALLQILALAEERVSATRLLEILAIPPVRARFGLGDDDVADLRELILESGIRWAWDAADRARHDQPRVDQNTVRFGLERLALGLLMHDTGGLGTVPAAAGSALAPAVPVELSTRDRAARFGRLADICARLEGVRGRVGEAASSHGWCERLRGLLDDFTRVEDAAAWLRGQVDDTLARLLPDDDGEPLQLDRTAVAALLRGAFDLPVQGDRPVTGAATVCALEPMRSVPFRVIAVLGLDDGLFPRPARTPAWDPFATPRPGEHDRRTVDRHLFLEAVLCARDALLLFGNGFEPKRGTRVPLSVVASEIVEVVAAGVGRDPADLLIEHPLQPWSEKAFADERRLPVDALWVHAARALRGERVDSGLAATSLDARWPEEDHTVQTLTAGELAHALARPQAELLKSRLHLSLETREEVIADREPLEQGTLEEWGVRDRLLAACEADAEPDLDALELRLRGEGELPLRAAGRHALEKCLLEVREAKRRAASVTGLRSAPLQASCDADGLAVTAVATDVRETGGDLQLVWVTASKDPNATQLLLGWITLLVAVASGAGARAAHVIGCRSSVELAAPADADTAHAHLAALVQSWRRIRRGPLPLFPRLSRDLVNGSLKEPSMDAADLVEGLESVWEGAPHARGDRDDPWVSALFGHLSVEDLARDAGALLEAANPVWRPLLQARVSKKKASTKKKKGTASASGDADEETT
jgi:exodeoxyribonuclease V gamma subunit